MRLKVTAIFVLFFSLSLVLVFTFACRQKEELKRERIPFSYQVPVLDNDGWETAHLLDVGINEDLIWKMMYDYFSYSSRDVHSILIVKDKKLVFEHYWAGHDWFGGNPPTYKGEYRDFDRYTLHNLHSATKSFTSALVGLAIEKGYIRDVEDRICQFYPEYEDLFINGKRKIELRHLLTMSSGLKWNEGEVPLDDEGNDLLQILDAGDPIAFILAKDLAHDPGTFWLYSAGDTNIAGDIIRKTSGFNIDWFSREYFFPMLGITDYYWQYFPRNRDIVYCSGDIYLRPRDMAKFGQLFLDKGVWDSRQIIPEEWVIASTKKQIDLSVPNQYSDGYGYQWWLNTYTINDLPVSSFSARGFGGQTITIFPELNSVVVFTGGNYLHTPPDHYLMENYIIPALINE